MKAIKYFLFAAACVGIAGVFILFSWQNNDRIQVHLFNSSGPLFPISGYLMIAFMLGVIFSGLFFILTLFRMKALQMSFAKQVKKVERELQQLRNQPLDGIPQNRPVEVAKLVENDESLPRTQYLQSP